MNVVARQARAPSKLDFDGLALLWLQLAGALCARPASTVRVLAPLRVPSLQTTLVAANAGDRSPAALRR